MKTKTPISILVGGFVVVALLATSGFWMRISTKNQLQNVDNQPVSQPNAAVLLLQILPATMPEKTEVQP
jgi:hypothetical protein